MHTVAILYGWAEGPWQTKRFVATRHKPENLPSPNRRSVVLIRPRYDTICHPDIMKLLPAVRDYEFLEIPGAHDDCWMEPKPYLDILRRYFAIIKP